MSDTYKVVGLQYDFSYQSSQKVLALQYQELKYHQLIQIVPALQCWELLNLHYLDVQLKSKITSYYSILHVSLLVHKSTVSSLPSISGSGTSEEAKLGKRNYKYIIENYELQLS